MPGALDLHLAPLSTGVDAAGWDLGIDADVVVSGVAVQVGVEGNEALTGQDSLIHVVLRPIVELDVREQLPVHAQGLERGEAPLLAVVLPWVRDGTHVSGLAGLNEIDA